MATGYDIIRRALRLCRVADGSTAMEPEDAADALDTLNAMLAEWHHAGIGLPDYELTGLTSELSSGVADREAVAYQLAMRIAPEYGVDLDAATVEMAGQSMSRLRLRYFQPGVTSNDGLPNEERGFNIVTGDA